MGILWTFDMPHYSQQHNAKSSFLHSVFDIMAINCKIQVEQPQRQRGGTFPHPRLPPTLKKIAFLH